MQPIAYGKLTCRGKPFIVYTLWNDQVAFASRGEDGIRSEQKILQSQFIENSFKKAENSEQKVVLLLLLITLDSQSKVCEEIVHKLIF